MVIVRCSQLADAGLNSPVPKGVLGIEEPGECRMSALSAWVAPSLPRNSSLSVWGVFDIGAELRAHCVWP